MLVLFFCIPGMPTSYGWHIAWVGIQSAVHSGNAGTFKRHDYRRYEKALHEVPKRGVGSWVQSGDRAVTKELEVTGQAYTDAAGLLKRVHFDGTTFLSACFELA
jgi:hypothetical protein